MDLIPWYKREGSQSRPFGALRQEYARLLERPGIARCTCAQIPQWRLGAAEVAIAKPSLVLLTNAVRWGSGQSNRILGPRTLVRIQDGLSMSGNVGRAWEILREDGLLVLINKMLGKIYVLTNKLLGKTYRTTLRRMMPQVGYFYYNGVEVADRRLFDRLTPKLWRLRNKPDYEHTEVEGVNQYVGESDDVVVIGGGFGVTAVHAANNTGGTVTVVEADQDRYQNLTRIFAANDVSHQVESIFGYLGDLHIDLGDSDTPMIAYRDIPEADVWDIDCEGAEIEILQNLPYNPSTILVETHDNHAEVIRLLEDLDYQIVDVVDDGIGQSRMCTHIRAKKEHHTR